MKKNILKYSSLLTLLGASFFSTQIFANCGNGDPASVRGNFLNQSTVITGNINQTEWGRMWTQINLYYNGHNECVPFGGDAIPPSTPSAGILLLNEAHLSITLNGNLSSTAGLYSNALMLGYGSTGPSNISITINGNITANVEMGNGIYVGEYSSYNTIIVNGDITATADGAYSIFMQGDSNTVTVSGDITSNEGTAIMIGTQPPQWDGGSIGSGMQDMQKLNHPNNIFNLGGDITGSIINHGQNTIINKTGGRTENIINSGTITHSGNLPDRHESVHNGSNYGRITFTSTTQAAAGPTTFSPHAGSSSAGVRLTEGTYTGVISGISSTDLHATRTGVLSGNGTSSAGSANWTLSESALGSSVWDLAVTGNYHYFGSVAKLQSSVQATANNMRGAFNSMTGSMNFANMTTYDCDLFGGNGGCVSVGGRYTGTDNPDTSASAIIAKAGYKFNEHFRYGAFVDQTVNSKSHQVDMDMNTPMIGLMGVWNQNPDQLGMQMKLANTYQKTDATITRDAPISGDDYKGDTDINAQSYVAELSWRHLNNQKDTLLQPFVATRYAIIDQDGYSDGLVTYGSVEQKTLTALGGVKAKHQLNPKMTLTGSIGVEHDLDEDTDDLSVSVSGVSGLTAASMTSGGEDKTRLLGSVGAQYYLTKDQRIEAKFMYEQLRYNDANYKTAYVNYMIGF